MSPCTMCTLAGGELGVLQALRRIQLAMAAGLVEHLGQRAHDVVVVVEAFMVVAAGPAVPTDEDGVRAVDHQLPHVVVGEQVVQRAEPGQVAHGPLDHGLRVGQLEGAVTAAVVEVPLGDLVLHHREQRRRARRCRHVQCERCGPLLHPLLDVLQR